MSDDEKREIGKIGSDLCVINYSDQTDRFIRCVLFLKVNDHCEDLQYGLWVSLSEKSFQDYKDNFDNPDHEAMYFGWLSSTLLDYDDTCGIPTTIFTKKGSQRSEIVPHKDFEHQFVTDYYNGITKEEAERRIRKMLEIAASFNKNVD
ncbi:hypothetical protein GCM10009415_15270 [Chitinophaga japonensis]